MVINYVQSQFLLRESDVNEFAEWLKAGNYDDETELADRRCRKGESFSFKGFAIEAWEKFTK